MVMFPILRRTDEGRLTYIYGVMRTGLMIPLLGMLVFYYPIRLLLSLWLPQYADSLVYMAILFPMCLYECKMSMLIETYMKALRKERWLLLINVGIVFISVVITWQSVIVLNNLDLAVVSIVLLLGLRSTIAEVMLAKTISIEVKKDILLENTLAAAFIVLNWTIGGILGVALYGILYIIYLVIKKDELLNVVKFVQARFKAT